TWMDDPPPTPEGAASLTDERQPLAPSGDAAPEPAAVTQALDAVDALLADGQQPDPAALTALANSLEALLTVAPDDPRIRQRLLAVNRRLAEPQPLGSATNGPGTATAATPASATAEQPAARPAIELVLVPPTPHK